MFHSFSCVPCLLSFSSREEQSCHLKSEFHTYNLRRRQAELLPVTPEEYARKLELIRDSVPNEAQKQRKQSRKVKEGHRSRQRNVCATSLLQSSQSQFLPQTDNGESTSDDIPEVSAKTPVRKEYETTFSFLDDTISENLQENLAYMENRYGLFIPNQKYVTDLDGFVSYLGQKVFEGRQCLYCNRTFGSIEAVRKHMDDKGHRRIGTHLDEHAEEYEEFYDYSTSYKELNLPTAAVAMLAGADEDDEDWENVSEYEEVEESFDDASDGDGAAVVVGKKSVDEKTWEEKLLDLGYRRPYICTQDNMAVPMSSIEIVNRKNVRKGRILREADLLMQRHHSKAPAGMLTQQSHGSMLKMKIAEKNDRSREHKIKTRSNMRLGVKANTLYRYIARKNKIFI